MSKTGTLWMEWYEKACNEYRVKAINREQFVKQLQELGLDEDDILDHCDAMESN